MLNGNSDGSGYTAAFIVTATRLVQIESKYPIIVALLAFDRKTWKKNDKAI